MSWISYSVGRFSGVHRWPVLGVRRGDLPDYTMYIRTLSRGNGAGSFPSGPHYVNAYPPFERHPRHARSESVIQVSQARYAKPRAIVDAELKRNSFG